MFQREEDIKAKFRSYKELKEDFEAMNMDIKTDGEIVTDLLERFKDDNTDTLQKLQVLADLEYYLHQVSLTYKFQDNYPKLIWYYQ